MTFESIEKFLDWIYDKSAISFGYKCDNKNYIQKNIKEINFCDLKSPNKIYSINLPIRKKENGLSLRIIRKALIEVKPIVLICDDLKSFLNFIPGSFKIHEKVKILDINLMSSMSKFSQEDPRKNITNCFKILKQLIQIKQNLSKKQLLLYEKLLIPCIKAFSDLEKEGIPNKFGTKNYCFYNLNGTVSGRLTNDSMGSERFINPLNIEKKNRKKIKAPYGYRIISADYNALEVRILAYLCNDSKMNFIFEEGKDVYSVIGELLFKEKNIDNNVRNLLKNLCFIIIFGGTEYGLSEKIKCSITEAEVYFKKFFDTFPSVKEWINETSKNTIENKSSQSLTGRIRNFNNLKVNNELIIRQGQNFKIQSLANDIVLMALIEISSKLSPLARILMSVHDDIIILSPLNQVDQNINIINNIMKNPNLLKEFGINNNLKLKPIIKTTEYWE